MTLLLENETTPMLLIGRRRGQGFTIGANTHIVVTAVSPANASLQLRRHGEPDQSLTLNAGDKLQISARITVYLHELDRTWARIAIDAPRNIPVIRDEVRSRRKKPAVATSARQTA